MKKRIIAMLLMVVMVMGMLCGCKEEGAVPESTGGTKPVETGLEATLRLSCELEGEALEALNEQLTKFQTQFPGIQVTLVTAGEGDAEPNVACVTPEQAMDYYQQDKLVEMDGWINDEGFVMDAEGGFYPLGLTDEQKADIVELYFLEGQQFDDELTYMMPLYRESLVIYFNRTYLEENEMPIPYTWEDVEAVCQQAKEANPEVVPMICRDSVGLFLSLCKQYGTVYNAEEGLEGLLTSEGARMAAQKINDLTTKGYMTTEEKTLNDDGIRMVIASSAMTLDMQPAGSQEAFAYEMGVMNLPHTEESDRASLAKGPGLVILRTEDDDQMLAAWLLVKSLTTDENFQAQLAMKGSYIPVLTSVEINEEYSKYLDNADGGDGARALTALTCMEQQHTLFTAPVYPGSAEAAEKLAAVVEQCMTADSNVEAVLEAAISN